MLRSFKVLFVSGVLIGASAAPAVASPLVFSDIYDPTDIRISAGHDYADCAGLNTTIDSASGLVCQSVTWTHALSGFDPLTDTLTSGLLSLSLSDDLDNPAEKFDIVMDLLSANNQKIRGTPSFNVLTQLLDGSLLVTLSAQNGDFLFVQSVLSVEGTRAAAADTAVTAMPEPATLLLFGSGVVLIARRRWLTRRLS